MRFKILRSLFVFSLFFCHPDPIPAIGNPVDRPPNILFIAVDDLRPELNCYGRQHMQSPYIDRLAADGVLFSRAYCNIPVCGASRASLLTGTRPTRDRFLDYDTWAEKDNPEAITLPEHFRNNGYYTVSNGKIFHHLTDSKDSWDEVWFPDNVTGEISDYLSPENMTIVATGKRGFPYESMEVGDSAYFDGKLAIKAIEDLKRLKESQQPFFLALGFFKPHLPFNAPAKYWEMYDRDGILLPDTYRDSVSAPDTAFHSFGELRAYHSVPPTGPVSDSMAVSLIHGYYACVSYMDMQVGRVLTALEDLGLKENTIVVLWGDHGYNLGEHTLWCKHCNFSTSLQVPVLMAGPGIPGQKKVKDIVELVDIYPTLCELAGLSVPEHQLEGTSMVAVMQKEAAPWKQQAVSKFYDGVSLITDRYVYTEWGKSDSTIYARMLFDHVKDPEEKKNIAGLPQNRSLVKELQQRLHKGGGSDFNKNEGIDD